MSQPATHALQPYLDAFAASACGEHAAPAVLEARQSALARAVAHGWPTRRDERWRYSDLRVLSRRHFSPAGAAPVASPPASPFPAALDLATHDGHPLAPGALPSGVTVDVCGPARSATVAALALEAPGADAFAELNTAFAQGGLHLRIARGAAIDGPIVLTHHLSAAAGRAAHPRVVVELAAGAKAAVVERFVGGAGADGLSNACTTVRLGAGAALDWLHLQDQDDATTHIAMLEATLAADAQLALRALHLGALLGRFAARIELAGPRASAELHALNATDGRRRGDLLLEVRHTASDTRSRQTYRGVASGRSKAAVTSRAVVGRDAPRCDAAQSLASLLLSPHAEADARPELEIENDDVRCSHGATIGQLDEAALFYLRSRGIGAAEARAALVFAFADAILNAVPRGPLREHLEQRLHQRIDGGAGA